MSCLISVHKEGIEKKPSKLKENEKNKILGGKMPIEHFDKEKIKIKIKEIEKSIEKYEISENSSCSCSSKDKATYNYTLEELQWKRIELINLQKAMLNLKLLRHQQKKFGAKLLKLSLNSKVELSYPDINLNLEAMKKIKYENELVKSEIQHLIKNNVNQHWTDGYQLEGQRDFLKSSNELVYKMLVGRIGHLSGLNLAVFVVLSSEAFWVVDGNSRYAVHCRISYEDIDTVIVGKSERWLSVVERNLTDSRPRLQIEFGDPATPMSLLKYLEVALRRRLIVLAGRGRRFHPKKNVSRYPHHDSIGRWLESLLPSVVSYSDQEARLIEEWLMKQLKIQKRPRVLACWLVFWESGSEFWCEKDARTDLGPRLEGFLMVSSSPRHNRWTPCYFYLKEGMLHQFTDPRDRLPQFVMKVQEFCGCRRLPSTLRPHSFELLRKGGGAPLAFAAANEDVASQWVQALLGLLGVSQKQQLGESRRLRPCQVIQTGDFLVLSRQNGVAEDLYRLSRDASVPLTVGGRSECLPLNFCPFPALAVERQVESKDKFRRSTIFSGGHGEAVSSRMSSSVPVHLKDWDLCPPTPPLSQVMGVQSRLDEGVQGSPLSGLQLLAFCSLDQIAEVFVTTKPSNACFMEFECSEASEVGGAGGDWALYFESEKRLAHFLASVLASREHFTQELMGLTQVSRGRMHDLLIEGSAASAKLWKPQ